MIRHASAVVIVLVLNATPLFGQSAGAPAAELIVKATAADVHKVSNRREPGYRARRRAARCSKSGGTSDRGLRCPGRTPTRASRSCT